MSRSDGFDETADRDYLPIGDYALIGESRSAALVSRDGSIDWLCWPRFDSPSIFARILDAKNGGHFAITPATPFRATRQYIEGTNVLETTFECTDGAARIIDLMPAADEETKRRDLRPFRQLLRRVEGIRGTVPFDVTYAPRPDYATRLPTFCQTGPTLWTDLGNRVLHLTSSVSLSASEATARAKIEVSAGTRFDFALGFDDHTPAVFCGNGDAATRDIDSTTAFWRRWISQLTYDGEHRSAVERSVLALKLLSYAPSGAIIAAPTTSLPEWIGGVRNWDYRYCWLRDASFTVRALFDAGFKTEGDAFVEWLLYSTRLTHSNLQVLYSVFGESKIPERELTQFSGYRDTAPVRAGNAAHDQLQLDVYGEVLGAVELYVGRGHHVPRDTAELIRRLADVVVRRWREADSGIWEKRSGPQQHVHSKVMCWLALDSARRIVEKSGIRGDVEKWKTAAGDIRRLVLSDGFDAQRNHFSALLGNSELDASLLYLSRAGFLRPDDPRILGTVDAIQKRLTRDDLVYRYRDTDDGLPGDEGAFLPCSFWLVEALALGGRRHEADRLFSRLLTRANDVGLYSEEIDPSTGELLGNFPQALTHIALLSAAMTLARPSEASADRAQRAEESAVHDVH